MSGELVSLGYDLADHLTVELAGAGVAVKVTPFPPDGVAEPAVWLEETSGREGAMDTAEWDVVLVVPAGGYLARRRLLDTVREAVRSWRPVTTGAAVTYSEVAWAAGEEVIGGAAVPGARVHVPTTWRPC